MLGGIVMLWVGMNGFNNEEQEDDNENAYKVHMYIKQNMNS